MKNRAASCAVQMEITEMSQEKVDRNKEAKQNRKKTVAKERRNRRITLICGSVLAVALVVWVGVSGYNKIQENREETVVSTGVNVEALGNYLDGLAE